MDRKEKGREGRVSEEERGWIDNKEEWMKRRKEGKAAEWTERKDGREGGVEGKERWKGRRNGLKGGMDDMEDWTERRNG